MLIYDYFKSDISIPDGDVIFSAYDCLKLLSEKLKENDSTFSDLVKQTEKKPPTIKQLKKMIKHAKSPLEQKQLNKMLNEMYKERKKCKKST